MTDEHLMVSEKVMPGDVNYTDTVGRQMFAKINC